MAVKTIIWRKTHLNSCYWGSEQARIRTATFVKVHIHNRQTDASLHQNYLQWQETTMHTIFTCNTIRTSVTNHYLRQLGRASTTSAIISSVHSMKKCHDYNENIFSDGAEVDWKLIPYYFCEERWAAVFCCLLRSQSFRPNVLHNLVGFIVLWSRSHHATNGSDNKKKI